MTHPRRIPSSRSETDGRDDRDRDGDEHAQDDDDDDIGDDEVDHGLRAAGARDAGAAQAQSGAVSYCGDERRPGLERERRVDVEEQRGGLRTVECELVRDAAAGEEVGACVRTLGGSCSGRSKRRIPGSSLGTCEPSQSDSRVDGAASRRRRSSLPGRSRARTGRDPASPSTQPSVHPAGSDATQGTDDAVGTACAMRIMVSLVPQSAPPVTLSLLPGNSRFAVKMDGQDDTEEQCERQDAIA